MIDPTKDIHEAVFPLKSGHIVLTWPKNITGEDADTIERWAEIMLRQIRRMTQAANVEARGAGAGGGGE